MKSNEPSKKHLSHDNLRVRYKKKLEEIRVKRKENEKLQKKLNEKDAQIADLSEKWERALAILRDSKGKISILHSAEKT